MVLEAAFVKSKALLHVCQVHMVLEAMDPDGQDLSFLIRNDSMDIWTEFFKPNLDNGTLKGNTLNAFLKSLEVFGKFIQRAFLGCCCFFTGRP